MVLLGWIYIFLLVPVAILSYWGGPIILGSDYKHYAWLFPLLIANSAISVHNQLQIARLYAEGEARTVAKGSRVSTICGLLVVVPLALAGGVTAAAIAPILIQVLLLGYLEFSISRRGLRDSEDIYSDVTVMQRLKEAINV